MAPYQAEPMDAVLDGDVRSVVLMWASQTGKTEILNNLVGYFIDQDPALMLMVQPTIEFGEAWSKERFASMIRDNPRLKDKVDDAKSRTSENTILMKHFPGGNLAVVGANAPAGLAGRPRRIVFLDEIDRYPESAGTEGDPVSLAERRTESFHNSVIVKTSTPTLKDISRIEADYNLTDQRKWHVRCARCDAWQVLQWCQVVWPKAKPELAGLQCAHCSATLSDEDRVSMVLRGEWKATAEFRGSRGYWLSGINSPWPCKRGFKSRLHQMAVQFLESKHLGKEALKTWTNTFLAETFGDDQQALDATGIMARCEDYGAELPHGALVLVAGADVQQDRIECEVVAYGVDEESWGIHYEVFPGNTELPEVWQAFAQFLERRWSFADGSKMGVARVFVDAAYNTPIVLRFAKTYRSGIVCGCRANEAVKELWPKRKTKSGIWLIGADEARTRIQDRLGIEVLGPRYCHFPTGRGYDDEYFAQLTAEKRVYEVKRGFRSHKWVKTRARNEAFDIRVYALAALMHLNVINWAWLAKKRLASKQDSGQLAEKANEKPMEEHKPAVIELKPKPMQPNTQQAFAKKFRRPGWASSWR